MAVMGAGAAGAAAYARAGLNAFEIGDEAIIDFRGFSLSGPGMKQVRTAVARLQRRGYVTVVQRHHALDAAGFAEMADAAAQWRGDGGDERGFSMALGRVEDPLDGDCVLVTARDADGALRGFLSFVPWGRNGLSLDLMRRDPTADNGLVELMVSALAERSATIGVGPVSLNFAMFREAFERGAEIGAGPGGPAVATGTAAGQPQLAARVALPLQREVPARLAAAVPLLRVRLRPAPGRRRRRQRRGLPVPSVARPGSCAARGRTTRGTLASATLEYAESVRRLIPPPEDAVAAALACRRVPEQVRVRRAKVDRLRARGIDPYPVTCARTPHAGGGARRPQAALRPTPGRARGSP